MLETLLTKFAGLFLEGVSSKAVTTKPASPFDLLSFHQSGQPIYTDMTIRKATREGYRMSIAVYRAVRTVVQSASGVPWVALDKNGEEIPNHPFNLLINKPNPEFSGQDLMEFTISHLKLVGNALWYPLIYQGVPRELWMVMPDMVKPIPSDVAGEWLKGWQLTTAQGKTEILPPEAFIHFMQFDPGNPYWGVGDLMAAARTVDTDNEAQDSQKVIMQNRSVPPGVFQFDSPLDQEQGDEAARRVREKFLQKSKRGEPWVLSGGYKWIPMSLTPKEMDYILSRLQNKRDIAAAFGIDPWWVGDREHSTYNNVAEARRGLYEDAVIPLLDDLRSTLNLRLAPMYRDAPYLSYDLSNVAALRDDFGKKAEQAHTLWTMGVPFDQINSKLELGFDEFTGWDTGYLPFSVMPAGTAPAQEGAKMQTKTLNLTTEEQKSTHWKRIDSRRVAWWTVIQKKLIPLYEAEGKAVAAAYPDVAAAIKKRRPEWEKTLTAIDAVLVEDFGSHIADDLGAKSTGPGERKWVFDPYSAAVRAWLAKHVAKSVVSIAATDLEDVTRVIRAGVEANQTNAQIAKLIRQYYTEQASFKAMRVARTETTAAAGYGQREAAKQSGFVKTKQWISSRDSRVRDAHQPPLDGQVRGIDDKYSNGLMYPGDTSGPPAEFIQCRCAESYGTEAV